MLARPIAPQRLGKEAGAREQAAGAPRQDSGCDQLAPDDERFNDASSPRARNGLGVSESAGNHTAEESGKGGERTDETVLQPVQLNRPYPTGSALSPPKCSFFSTGAAMTTEKIRSSHCAATPTLMSR
jgi:hypothetical protein